MSHVLESLAASATQGGGSIALSDERRTYTYAALHTEIGVVARLLRERIPGRGPVAIVADNSCAWVLLDLAFILLKRPLVPLPHFFTAEQRRSALARVGAEVLITDVDDGSQSSIEVAGSRFHITKLNAQPVDLPDGTTKITFTSGTTGNPKGVCLSQPAMERVSISLVDTIGKDKAGVHLPVLPLAVLLENIGGLYTTLLAGGHYRALSQNAIGFAKPFEPDFPRLIGALADSGAASAIMVPELLRGTIAALFRSKMALPDLKYVAVGGARVSSSLLEMVHRLRLPVYQGYGLSEAASVVALNTVESDRQGSVGKPLPHVKLSLAEDGEILIEEPGFLGYSGEGLRDRRCRPPRCRRVSVYQRPQVQRLDHVIRSQHLARMGRKRDHSEPCGLPGICVWRGKRSLVGPGCADCRLGIAGSNRRCDWRSERQAAGLCQDRKVDDRSAFHGARRSADSQLPIAA